MIGECQNWYHCIKCDRSWTNTTIYETRESKLNLLGIALKSKNKT